MNTLAPIPAATAPCGLSGLVCAKCPQLRGCPTLRGLGILPAGFPGFTIPEWLKDWRVWLAILLLLFATGLLGGRTARRRRRKRLAEARLRYLRERLG